MQGDFIAFDLETTGLNANTDEIIEIGVARFRDGELLDQFQSFAKPSIPIPADITHLTGIHPEDVEDAPGFTDLIPELRSFFADLPVIAHSAGFDMSFMRKHDMLDANPVIDTFELASIVLPSAPRYSLFSLTAAAGIKLENAHRALDDAIATGYLYWHLWNTAIDIPAAALGEIIGAGKGLSWDLAAFFQGAMSASLRQGEGSKVASPFYAETLKTNRIAPSESSPATIDQGEVEAIFRERGSLSSMLTGYESRPPQIQMAREVCRALNLGEQTMIEAGTGTGKSLAYLIPAAMWAIQNDQRVVVSTNTINLQDQLLNKDIPIAKKVVGEKLQASVMKGRGNYLCPRRLEILRRRKPSSLEELRTLAKVLIWMQLDESGDRGSLSLRAGEWNTWSRLSAQDENCSTSQCATLMHGTCPFYRARQRAERAHIVIANHALLIADARIDNRALPEYYNLIVDEAHHFENAITDGLSRRIDQGLLIGRLQELSKAKGTVLGNFLLATRGHIPADDFSKLESFAANIGATIKQMTARVRRYFRQLHEFAQTQDNNNRYQMRVLDSHREKGGFAPVQNTWRQLGEYFLVIADKLAHLSAALQRYKRYQVPDFEEFVSEFRAQQRYLEDLHELLEQFTSTPDPAWIYSIAPGNSPEQARIHITPLHVGPLMESYLSQRKECIILTSATLRTQGNFHHLKERLYAERFGTLSLGSPFDYERSTLVYVPDDIPEPSQRSRYQKMLERGIIDLAAALDGRLMVLFTSYAQLRETSRAITPRLALGEISVYDQSFGVSRDVLLDSFKSADKAVLMGTRSFWEGIDVPGEDLSAVVIARLPFAVPTDPIFAARSETYNNPFQEYAIPDAVLRFRQGFGRLIRSKDDRGIVAIFDSRVISKSYGNSFLESLPDCTTQYGSMDNLAPAATRWLSPP